MWAGSPGKQSQLWGQKGRREGTKAGPPRPEFALGPPGQLPRLPGLSVDGAPAAPWLPGVCFGSTLLNGCTETVPEHRHKRGSEGEGSGGRSPPVLGLRAHAHGHVTSSPADARDKAGRIPMPRA